MTGNEINCVKAVYLKNQRAPLTHEDRELLKLHLAGCYECREVQISCTEALSLIDGLSPREADQNSALRLHIAKCGECRAAKILEPSLRLAIAPVSLPTPSMNFEAILASKLAITPVVVKTPVPAELAIKNEKVSLWSWTVAAVTLAIVITAQLPKAYAFIADIPNLFIKFMAFLASHLTGEAAIFYSQVKHSTTFLTPENLNYAMVLTVVAFSITAASRILFQDD